MTPKIRILVVDDQFPAVSLEDIAEAFGVGITLVGNERDAREYLEKRRPDFPELILMDGYLSPMDERPRDTQVLVHWIRRQGYQGLMIAMSMDEKASQRLVQAGCNEAWKKEEVIPKLKQWIKEQQSKE